MTCFHLSPLTRQLIILLLLIALLWHNKPAPGPDGRIAAEYIHEGSMGAGNFSTGDKVSIFEVRLNAQFQSLEFNQLFEAITISEAIYYQPKPALESMVTNVPFLNGLMPKRLLIHGGWRFVIKLNSEEWNQYQDALQRGCSLEFIRLSAGRNSTTPVFIEE